MKRILFVCTGNTCRSPMAQALFQKILASKPNPRNMQFEISSAGIHAREGESPSLEAVEAMRQEGIDLTLHKTRAISNNLIKRFDLVLTMTATHCGYLRENFPEYRGIIFTLSEYAGIGNQEINDPYGLGRQAYLETARQLKEVLDKAAERLLKDIEK